MGIHPESSMIKTALITSVTGQDGADFAGPLMKVGDAVHRIRGQTSSFDTNLMGNGYQDPQVGRQNAPLPHGVRSNHTNLLLIYTQILTEEIRTLNVRRGTRQKVSKWPSTASRKSTGCPCSAQSLLLKEGSRRCETGAPISEMLMVSSMYIGAAIFGVLDVIDRCWPPASRTASCPHSK